MAKTFEPGEAIEFQRDTFAGPWLYAWEKGVYVKRDLECNWHWVRNAKQERFFVPSRRIRKAKPG